MKWIQEQDFYEDTTIILNGDHPTMQVDFPKGGEEDYIRNTYTAYINAAVDADPSMGRRTYSTFDCFPTTLAAIGGVIEGNRLGLGTNLFSTEKTLTEQYGMEYEIGELQKKSTLLADLEGVQENLSTSASAVEEPEVLPTAQIDTTSFDPVSRVATIRVSGILSLKSPIRRMTLDITDPDGNREQNIELLLQEDGSYQADVNLADYQEDIEHLTVTAVTGLWKKTTLIDTIEDITLSCGNDLASFVNRAQNQAGRVTLIASVGEPLQQLNLFDIQALQSIGVNEDAMEETDRPFGILMSDSGIQIERGYSPDVVTLQMDQEGHKLKLEAAGIHADQASSIMVDDSIYEESADGLIAQVYDLHRNLVVNTSYFNTTDEDKRSFMSDISLDEFDGKSASITVDNLHRMNSDVEDEMELYIRYHDAGHPAKVKNTSLYRTGDQYHGTMNLRGVDPSAFYYEIVARDEHGREATLGTYYTDLSLKHTSIDAYFTSLAEHKQNYSVFMSIKGDAAWVSDSTQNALIELGAQNIIKGADQQSYYLAVDRGNVIAEGQADESISAGGFLSDGSTLYELQSTGGEQDTNANIRINSIEYASNINGLNVVVYDNDRHQVIDVTTWEAETAEGMTRRERVCYQ